MLRCARGNGHDGRRGSTTRCAPSGFSRSGLLLWLVVPEISADWWPHPIDIGAAGTVLMLVVACLGLVLRSAHPLIGLS